MRITLLASCSLVAALAAGGCGSDDKKTDTTTGAQSGGASISLTASGFKFSPTDLEVEAGAATIKVDNQDSVEHNLTIEGLGVKKDLESGETTAVAVNAKAGTYKFFCEYHPTQMKGTIVVK